jgi:hypothetical protein
MASERPFDSSPPATAPPERSHLRQLLAQSWHASHPVAALYCVPAVAGALLAGLLLHQPGPAILITAGAFSVGFGAFQRVSRLHVAPMLLAALAMAAATAVGTIASANPWIDAACVAAAGLLLGIGTGFGTGPWWVLLQGAIFLIVSGSIPGDLKEGLARAGLVLAGGVVQAVVVAVLRAVAPSGFPPLQSPTATAHPETLQQWRAAALRVVSPRAPEWRYGLLLGLAAGVGVLVGHALRIQNGYWVAMTAMLVLRRGAQETIFRGTLRIVGTLVGAGVATTIVALLRPDPLELAPLIALAAWGAYSTQWVNYGTFSVCVTSYIAFLLSLEGLPETAVAGHRIVATLIGGAIGMAAFFMARAWRRTLELSGILS